MPVEPSTPGSPSKRHVFRAPERKMGAGLMASNESTKNNTSSKTTPPNVSMSSVPMVDVEGSPTGVTTNITEYGTKNNSFDSLGSAEGVLKKSLGPLMLLGLMFSNAIGGAYGLEESVQGGGAFLTILFVLLVPLIWGFPIALVVSELATALPSNGGFLMWINVSFHPIVYFTTLLLTLLLMFVDNAIYPNLFADYLCRSIECSDSTHKLLKAAMCVFCAVINIIGIEAVGIAMLIITFLCVSPFLLMFVVHLGNSDGYVNWDNVKAIPDNIEWVTFLPTVSWNLCGLEQAGSVAEEIVDPQTTIIKALIPLVGLVWLAYIPPIIAAVSVTRGKENLDKWSTGYWATVSKKIGGESLKVYTVIGGVVSALGLGASAITVTSRIIAGMGEANAFPSIISKPVGTYNRRFGTPHVAIIINAIFTGFIAIFTDFSTLVKVDQVLYGIRVIMILLAFIKLRHAYPTLPRPFSIPLSATTASLVMLIPILYSIVLSVISALVDQETFIMSIVIIAATAVVSFFYCTFFKKDGFDGKIVEVEIEDHDTHEHRRAAAFVEETHTNLPANIPEDELVRE